MASVVALDFGNENVVIALPRRGGVDIADNESGQRLTPTMVAFDELRRYSGEFARVQHNANLKRTITHLKRLVGLKYDDPNREAIEKLVMYPIVKLDDGYVGVQVNYCDQDKIFRVEQLLTMLISSAFNIARMHGTNTKDCVIVVPPWWDECQRRVMRDAATISGYEVLKLLNSTTAAAICYSMFHRKILPDTADKAVPVAFIDFGDSTMNVAITQLYKGSVEVKGFSSDEHLGGSDFTNVLIDILLEKIKAKYKIDVTTNQRAMLRLRAATEKCKKALSINPAVPFDVPNMMNDIDVSIIVQREEFDAKIGDLVERVAAPIQKALELAKVKREDLFAIEVHGGASRNAAVKAKIKEVFGRDPTQSLNPDECFAMGAGFQAAILCPQYKVDLNLKDVYPYKIMVDYDTETGEKKTAVLFNQFNVCPCTKNIPIKVVNNKANVRIYTETSDLGVAVITPGTDELTTVRLQVRLTPDGIVDVSRCFKIVSEEVEVKEEPKKAPPPKKAEPAKKEEAPKPEEPVKEGDAPKPDAPPAEEAPKQAEEAPKPAEEAPKPAEEAPKPAEEAPKPAEEAPKPAEEAPKPAEEAPKKEDSPAEEPAAPPTETPQEPKTDAPAETPAPEEPPKPKFVTVKREVDVGFSYAPTFGLSMGQIAEFDAAEREMKKKDELEVSIDNAKNELESYIYQMQAAMGHDYPEYFDPAKIESYRTKTDEVYAWFSEYEFDRLGLDEYRKKLSELKAFGSPALARRATRQVIPQMVVEFKTRIEAAKKRLDQKDGFEHITDALREPVAKEITDFIAWLDDRVKVVDETPKHLDAPFTRSECEIKANAIEGKVQGVLCTPKPKPEPKKEEPKKESEDAAKVGEEAKPEGDTPKPEGEEKAEEGPEELPTTATVTVEEPEPATEEKPPAPTGPKEPELD